jgi:hypothetical protein
VSRFTPGKRLKKVRINGEKRDEQRKDEGKKKERRGERDEGWKSQ